MSAPFLVGGMFGDIEEAAKAAKAAVNRSNKEAADAALGSYLKAKELRKKSLVERGAALTKAVAVDKAHGEAISINKKKDFKRSNKFFMQKFSKPLKKALGGIAKVGFNMAKGFLPFLDAIGVFEPILSVVADLIDLFAGRLIEKLMPAFMSIIDILLSDSVMSLIDTLAGLFAALLIPLLGLIEYILPPIISLIDKLIVAFMPLIEEVMKALIPIIMNLFDAFMPLINTFIDLLLPILGPLLRALIPIIEIGLMPLQLILGILSPILKALSPLFQIIGDVLVMLEGPLKFIAKMLGVGLMMGIRMGAMAIAVLIDIITFGFAGAVGNVQRMFNEMDAETKATQMAETREGVVEERKDKRLGTFQTGTPYVPESGLYHLTKGERVVTAQENIGGGDIHIVVEGNLVGQNAMRELVEEIEYKRVIGRL